MWTSQAVLVNPTGSPIETQRLVGGGASRTNATETLPRPANDLNGTDVGNDVSCLGHVDSTLDSEAEFDRPNQSSFIRRQ
jgi:hypothetical protein